MSRSVDCFLHRFISFHTSHVLRNGRASMRAAGGRPGGRLNGRATSRAERTDGRTIEPGGQAGQWASGPNDRLTTSARMVRLTTKYDIGTKRLHTFRSVSFRFVPVINCFSFSHLLQLTFSGSHVSLLLTGRRTETSCQRQGHTDRDKLSKTRTHGQRQSDKDGDTRTETSC